MSLPTCQDQEELSPRSLHATIDEQDVATGVETDGVKQKRTKNTVRDLVTLAIKIEDNYTDRYVESGKELVDDQRVTRISVKEWR